MLAAVGGDGERRDVEPRHPARSEERRSARRDLEAGRNEKGVHARLRSGGQTLQGDPRAEGSHSQKDEILEAIRDLARRIDAGDIDLEAQGRFVKAKAKR